MRSNHSIVVALLAAAILLGGAAAANVQTSSGAGITVTAERLSEAEGTAFYLVLDTHAGDLLRYPLDQLARIETADGVVTGPFAWEPSSDTSHHREGVLRLVGPAAAADAPMRLILSDVGVPERVFAWAGTAAAGSSEAPAPVASSASAAPASSAAASVRMIFVPVVADGAIAAIDLDALELAWTLRVSSASADRGAEAAMGIAASPDGRYVYTGDAVARELVVVDALRRAVVARVGLGHGVHAIDIAPDGRTLWVDGAMDGFDWLSATSVIDLATLEVVRTLAPALGSAAHLAFTPNGAEVWAPSITSNLAWAWDAATGDVIAAVPLTGVALAAGSPEAAQGLIGFNQIAIAPDGQRAYAVGPEASVVHVFDLDRRVVVATVRAGDRAHGIAVTPDGREVWTSNRSGSVTIIATDTLAVETIDLGGYANHVAFSRDGALAFVSRDTDVAVLDVASRRLIRAIEVGRGPHEFTGEVPAAVGAW
jgi:DNA-binding beta-propeller fold protein YncE